MWLSHFDRLVKSIDETPPVLASWQPVGGREIDWRPDLTTPRALIASDYVSGIHRGAVLVAVYYDQDQHSKLASTANQLLRSMDPRGHVISRRLRDVQVGPTVLPVEETELRLSGDRLLVRSWYWIDGVYTASPIRAKVEQAWSRLRGHGDVGAIIVVYGRVPTNAQSRLTALDDLTRQAAERLQPLLAARLREGQL